ncbi:MAG: TetR/AcrR family transcriptional regulator [Chloroflexi bacterium]|nr:TetR/AcrR family transcriptional regulator [Chloroflexota bacterium]
MSVKRPALSGAADASDSTTAPDAPPTARRSRNPHGQGARLREELIAAADRILAETGDLEAMSLRGVARAAGVAAPSIYLHFPDKYALLHAVLGRRFAQLGAAVREAAMQPDAPAEMLRAGCLAYCRFATEHPNAYRVLFGRRPAAPSPAVLNSGFGTPPTPQPPSPPPRAAEGEQGDEALSRERADSVPPIPVGAEAFGFLAEGIAACIDAGAAPPSDPFRAAIGVWTALHGIVALRGSVGAFPWPPLDEQVDDVLRGLVGLELRGTPHSRVTAAPAQRAQPEEPAE